jgi:hypothetical protein
MKGHNRGRKDREYLNDTYADFDQNDYHDDPSETKDDYDSENDDPPNKQIGNKAIRGR